MVKLLEYPNPTDITWFTKNITNNTKYITTIHNDDKTSTYEYLTELGLYYCLFNS